MEIDRTDEECRLRRPRRSKADIENAIEKAAISQIKRKGYVRSQVTDIVRKAKIEPIVFYNRYKNLEEFYDTFVKRYDYWLSDMHKVKGTTIKNEIEYSASLHALFDTLLTNTMIVELLRWEVSEGTAITNRTAAVHEIDFIDYINHLTDFYEVQDDADAKTVSALLIAGLYFLVLHKDRSSFAGIDVNTVEGRESIEHALSQLGTMLAECNKRRNLSARLRDCLSKEGLSPDAIERCIKEIERTEK